MAVKTIEVHLPEYHIKEKPDYSSIGKKVDEAIEKSFPDGKYVLRAIGSADHPNLTLDELAEIVLRTGTDRYDPARKGVGHDEFSGYDYDVQAGTIEIRDSKLVVTKDDEYPTIFGSIAHLFYEHAPLDRGYAVRIDLLLIYDTRNLVKARKFHPKARSVRKGLNRYLYKFKDPENKRYALLGVIKILR